MDHWYPRYFSQTWYANTFLVRRPNQIARATAGEREWNNIYDSGCHFTCLAMILDVDPARLASELRKKHYFFSDASIPAERLNGKKGGLVWDKNAPHQGFDSVTIENFWHATLARRTSLTLRYFGKTSTSNYEEGCAQIEAIRNRGRHVICGSREHSCLVAGENSEDYFVWDPDGTATTVEENVHGSLSLRGVFYAYPKDKIEFWEYGAFIV